MTITDLAAQTAYFDQRAEPRIDARRGVAGAESELRGTMSTRYRNGSVELIDGVSLGEWSRISGHLTEKGSSGVVSVLNSDSITIINLTEIARISWIVDRTEDHP